MIFIRRYLLDGTFHEVEEADFSVSDAQILEFLTPEEASARCGNLQSFHNLKRMLNEAAEYCEVEMMPDCIIGTLVLPDKQDNDRDILSVAYYLSHSQLLLIDSAEHFPALLNVVEQADLLNCGGIFQLFFRLLEYWVQGDMALLRGYEKRLATMENAVDTIFPKELQNSITVSRRSLLHLLSFYQQLSDMCVILSEDSVHLFPPEYKQHFSRLQARVDRLYDHTQILREYALQIREYHQARLDLKQNDTMRILTVVTALFLPLTLLTGWYGMNFDHMPELSLPFSYFILIILSLFIIGGEIWFFKKKGWF